MLIELVEKIKNPPILIVLKALYTGLPVEIEGHKYVLAKTNFGGEMLVCEVDCFDPTTGKHSKALVGSGMTIEQLSVYANKLTKEELVILSTNTASNYVK